VPPETGYRVEFREKHAAEAAAAGDGQTRSPTAAGTGPQRRRVEMRVAIMAAHIKTQADFVNVKRSAADASNLFPAVPD